MRFPFMRVSTRLVRSMLPVMMLMAGMLAAILPQSFTAPSSSILAHAHAASLNAIQIENSNPGTPGWNDFNAVLNDTTLSGYGSKISVNHGDSIDFYVTTTSSSVTIDIYRTGYYGGAGARKLTSLGTFPGVQQPMPTPDPKTGMISCNWTKTATLNVPSNWVTGVYLAKLTDANGDSSFIFFVVRDDGGHEAIDFQTSVTTYEAYNVWGGTSLYNNNTNGKIYPYAHATKVSFDRPFNPGDSNGAGHYFFWEYKFVYWAESQGFDLTYTTDVDTDTNVNPLTNHKAFLSVGHDEYWSAGMRQNVQNAINAGVNVAFFSGNAVYWQIRFEPNAAGVPDRVEVGYKDFADLSDPPGPDPELNVNNSIVTTNWRDPVVNQPENALMGVMYEEQVGQSYPFVVQNASNWVYTGTGFVNGSSVPGIVGYEYDRVWNNGLTPSGLTVLGNSPVVACCGVGNSVSNATIYKAASGAWVFAAGTIQWSWGLANIQGNTFANAGIQQMTTNILNAFTTGLVPAVNLSPTSLTFGNQAPGTTSAAQAVTLTNNGLSALSISSIAVTGTNAGDFAQTNNCPNSLAAGASCTINVTFTPTTNGSRTASVTITDSAPDSPQNVALKGTGYTNAPAATLSPTSISFGNQAVGSSTPSQAVTLTNTGTLSLSISSIGFTGTNASDFGQTNNCPSGSSTLAANASCTINVTFSPGATGSRSASLTLTDNASDSPQSVALTGTGVTGGSNVYFSDGFESGDLSKWTLSNSDSTGQISVQTAVVNSGSYAVALTNASGQYSYINTAISSPQTLSYTRFYFRLSSVSGGTMLAVARNANNGNVWEIDYDANRHGLDIYFWNGANTLYSLTSAQNVISANTWYYVEVQLNEITSGQAQAWLNGVSLGTVNNDLSTANPYARLMFFNSAASSLYVDDVKVANAYIGALAPSPTAKVSPGSLTFSTQLTGTTSAAQTVTLTNSGTAALNISSISFTGTNAGDFAQTNNCPASLAVNASCTISVTFSPTSAGSRTASLKLTDNADDSPQSIALSGTGNANAPAVSLSPTSVSFGNQTQGVSSPSQTITLTNSGTQPLSISSIGFTGTNASDFGQTNNCPSGSSTLAANASCTINVTFSPGATGSRSASLTLTDNASDSPQSVALSGTGMAPPTATYFSDGFESGDLSKWTLSNSDSTGQISVQTAVVNSGSYAVALTNASGQYSYINTAISSPQTLSYTRFYFRLSSVSGGTMLAVARNANNGNVWEIDYDANRHGLDIYFWNGANTLYSLTSAQNVISANTWYYVEVQLNEITSGQAQAWLNGVSLGTVNNDLSTANPYARLMFFNAAPASLYVDDVRVDNGYNGAITPAPTASFSPTSLTFNNQLVGTTSAAQTVTLTNSGAASLTISTVKVTGTNAGDFAQTNNCPASLAVNASCTISVTFSPAAVGSRVATLTVSDNADSSPQSLALSGFGYTNAPAVSLNPTVVNFGGQNTGSTSAAQTVTLTNSGNAALTINAVTVAGTNAGDFSQTNTCPISPGTLAVNASCTISITFSPTAAGSRTASLTLTDNAANSPQIVTLNGTGISAGVYFSDGFESGDFSSWSRGTGGNGQATVQTVVVHSGNDAASFTNASGQYTMVSTALTGGAEPLTYTTFSFSLSSLTSTSLIAAAQDSNGKNVWIIYYDAGRQGLDIYFWNGAGTRYDLYSNTNVISANTWYTVEVEDNEASSGHGEVWLNGTSIGAFDGDLSTSTPYATFILYYEGVGTIYFDDVAVKNTF